MEQARSLMEPQYLRFEDWLNELQGEREQLQQRLQQADETQARLETLRYQLTEQIDYIVSHRDDILDSVRRELLSQYEETRSRLRRAEAALSWSTAPEQPSRFRQDVARFRKEVEEGRPRTPSPAPLRVRERPLAVGDNVFVKGLNLKGTLVSLPEQQGDAEVSIGSVKIQVDPRRLSRVDGQAEPVKAGVSVDLGPMLDSAELDLRGQRVEESLIKLEELLDKAVRDGLSTLRVIHGRGTGALRNAIREHLRRHPLVSSFGPESPEHGGDGATSVHLK
jgi:DNA mismatch repair protein MutS2